MSDSKNILYLFSFMLLILTGCEAESSWAPLPDKGEEPVEVRFHASMVGASVSIGRAEYDTTQEKLEIDEQVGIWNEHYENLSLTCIDKTENTVHLEKTDGEMVYYPNDINNMTIYAYAPYTINEENEEPLISTENGTLKVTTEWEPNEPGVKDPIWGKAEVNKRSGDNIVRAGFHFTHQMARLRIQLKSGGVNYSKFSISLTFDQQQHGVMNLMNGEMSVENPEEKTYILYPWHMGIIYDRTILLGSTLKNIRVNIENYEYRYEYNYPWEKTFDASGKIHTITIDPEAIRTNQNTIIQPKS